MSDPDRTWTCNHCGTTAEVPSTDEAMTGIPCPGCKWKDDWEPPASWVKARTPAPGYCWYWDGHDWEPCEVDEDGAVVLWFEWRREFADLLQGGHFGPSIEAPPKPEEV